MIKYIYKEFLILMTVSLLQTFSFLLLGIVVILSLVLIALIAANHSNEVKPSDATITVSVLLACASIGAFVVSWYASKADVLESVNEARTYATGKRKQITEALEIITRNPTKIAPEPVQAISVDEPERDNSRSQSPEQSESLVFEPTRPTVETSCVSPF
jgi:glucan phosphoethanolaminetransferase (alkaline phosphatase superfamily)